MIKRITILMLLMALIVPWSANAQQTVTIGTGTSGKFTHPVNMYYSYSLTQQIYTADEINMAGNITSIAFDYAYSGAFTMDGFRVYMMQVDKSVFTSNTDMVALTDATLVYEGTFSANGAGWITLQLNTPFPYDGESNLLVCCFDPDSSKPGSSNYKFNTTSTTEYTAISYHDNSIMPNVEDVSSFNGSKGWYKYRNNIKLVIAPNNCQRPTTLEANGFTLTWTGGSGSYNVEYRKTSETNWTRAYTNLAATTCTLTLDPNTDYEARVQSACSGDETSSWKTVSFTTPCGVVTIDASHSWSEGFESYNDNTGTAGEVTDIRCWERVQINSTTHSPFVYRNYSTAASTGSASLELKTSSSTPVMVALPEFSEAFESLNVAFNYNCTSTSYTYTAELGYLSDVTNASTFVKLFDIPKPVTRSAGHSEYSQDLYAATAAANAPAGSRLAIKLATTTTSTPSWNFDDFVVSYVSSCHKPTGFSIVPNSITGHTATASWTGTSSGYNVYLGSLGPNGNVLNVNFNNGIPSNWTNSTPYPWTVTNGYIMSGNTGVASSTSSISVTATFPANGTVEFDAQCMGEGSSYDVCKFLIDNTEKFSKGANGEQWDHYTYDVTAGQHTFTWSYTKDSSVNPNGDHFAIDNVVMVASNIVWGDPIYVENTEYTFTGLTPETRYFVKVQSDCGDEGLSTEVGPLAFDTDVSCMPPTNLHTTNVTAHEAVLNWSGQADSYNVSYYKTFFFESFEEGLDQWTVYKEGDPASYEWYMENPSILSSDLQAHSGYYTALAASDIGVHADNWLVSPQIQIPSQATLKFWIMRSNVSTYKDEYEVRISTTGNAVTDFTTVLKEKEAANTRWSEVSIDLSEYDGQQCYIAIRHEYTDGFFIIVDDFGIFGWSDNIITTADSLLIEDLLPETEYLWHVQANCGDEDGLSQWSNDTTFTTLRTCPVPIGLAASNPTAHGATLNWYGLSENYQVMVGEIVGNLSSFDFEDHTIPSTWTNNSTYPWAVVSGGQSGSYYIKSGNSGQASTTSSISFTMTSTNDGTIEFDAECKGEGTTTIWDHCYFYIDNTIKLNVGANVSGWNHYSYEVTAGEHTFTWSYTKDGSVDPTGDYFAVDNIVVGSSDIASWTTYTVSEVPFILDDAQHIHPETSYSVKVKGICGDEETDFCDPITFTTTVTCLPIDSLSFTNLTATSVNLNWVLEDATQTAWQICLNGDETNLITADTNEDFLLGGLEPETEYTVKVRAFCDENDQSRWSDPITFTTPISCHAVNSLSYDNLTSFSVNLSWVLEDETQTAWQICLNGNENNLIAANTNEGFLLEDLTPNTEYTVKVRAYCGENDYSRWSSTVTFTTPEVCATPTDLTVANITSVSADLSWIGREDVESYTVRYRSTEGLVAHFIEDFSDNIDAWTMLDCESRTGITNSAFAFYSRATAADPHQYLISPDLTSFITSNSVLEFKYRAYAASYAETFMVGFSSTNNEVDSFTWSDPTTISTNVYQTYHIDLPAGTKYIAIQCVSYRKYFLYIDDIVIGHEAVAGQWMTNTIAETEAQLNNLEGGRTYEVQVRSDCNPDGWCDLITFSTELDGTKVFVTEGDWNTASNWIPEGAPALSSKVIIRADATIPNGCVAEANRIFFEGTTLTIENGGQLKVNSNITATIKKNIEGYGANNAQTNNGFYLIASPATTAVTAANAGLVTTDNVYDLYSWNRTATDEEWHNNHSGISMANGTGYLYANQGNVEMNITATLQRSSLPVTVTPDYNEQPGGGWSLYGNPFPCDAYLSSDEDVTFYRLIGTDFVPITGAVAPMEGFFVKATAAGQTFTISREAPAK